MATYSLATTPRGTCSICQDRLSPDVPTRTCDACHATIHTACWDHNDGCGTYRCERAPVALKVLVTSTKVEGAWGDTKTCPQCQKTLDAKALRCEHCRARFDTRAPMSPEEYKAQVARAAAARRTTWLAVGLFVASAIGVLAPLTLALGGGWMYVERRSLGRALDVARLLVFGSIALSAAYVALMLTIFGLGW